VSRRVPPRGDVRGQCYDVGGTALPGRKAGWYRRRRTAAADRGGAEGGTVGAAKESPTTQVLEWAVGKLSEASKVDWVEKLSSLASSRPAYLRNGVLTAAASRPAAVPASGSVSQAELDAALSRAARAEARVAELERRLAALNPQPEAPPPAEQEEDPHRSHWWSRHH
jgi:hypothetical protein